jgi:hypothetical protein
MALYEIVIGNQSGDTNYSRLVLSEEPLNESNVGNIVSVDEGWGEYVLSVKVADVIVNSWDEEENDRLMIIRNQLI